MAHQLVKKAIITPHSSNVRGCAISPDGTWVATGGGDKCLCITNIATHAKVYNVKCDEWVCGVAWSPDGKHLVAVTGGRVIRVANNNSHEIVHSINMQLAGCAFSPRGMLAIGGADEAVTLLDPSKNYGVYETFTGLGDIVTSLAFSSDGNLLAAGCGSGRIFIYGLTNDKWAQIFDIKHHSDTVNSLCFSPSGSMLLATSGDETATIWSVPLETTWSPTPYVTLKGHKKAVFGGAFLGDESHVVTASEDNILRVWRTTDGKETANYNCSGRVSYFSVFSTVFQAYSLSYHAASGTIVIGHHDGQIQRWQTAAYDPCDVATPLPSHACVRTQLRVAQKQASALEAAISNVDIGLRQQLIREHELKRSIADLEAKVVMEKKELAQMQTAEYIAQSREYGKLVGRHNDLLGIINVCTQTLDSLTDCLSVSGLEDLRGVTFKEWLCDIGLSKLQTALKDVDGNTLTMLNVEDVIKNGVSFPDAAALQLRGYIAHHKLSDDSTFALPRDSVLSWDDKQTANWIKTLGAPYGCLSDAGWHGAALCSLSPQRVVEAGKGGAPKSVHKSAPKVENKDALKVEEKGALTLADAVKFIGLVRQMRSEKDGDKDDWVAKWSGASTIGTLAT